ncbi:hypothetical protein D918_05246 [Trichuris suis]|nr:hypothetical protein D918_05246 [Trichuris suis]
MFFMAHMYIFFSERIGSDKSGVKTSSPVWRKTSTTK